MGLNRANSGQRASKGADGVSKLATGIRKFPSSTLETSTYQQLASESRNGLLSKNGVLTQHRDFTKQTLAIAICINIGINTGRCRCIIGIELDLVSKNLHNLQYETYHL